jgi:outer membrane protein TolC
MQKSLIILFLSILALHANTLALITNDSNEPKQMVLTLDDVIELATDSSLNAFIADNVYMAAYWEYKTYRAQKLPHLDLSANPADYRRTVTQEYNSLLNTYQYIQQQTFFSGVNLSVNQNITPTGGTIFIDSDIGRLENFGDNYFLQYNTVPARIGLRQPLFGYNHFKWQKKIEPVKFEKAKRQLVESIEEVSVNAIDYFFQLAAAQINYQIAEKQKSNADTLLNLGLKRFELASISREDLYMLQLDQVNADNNLERIGSQLKRAQMNLNSYLRLDATTIIKVILPENIPNLQINPLESLEHAKANNPKIFELKEQIIQSESDVERTLRQSRFNANLNMSYGLNQRAGTIPEAYSDPMSQQIVLLGISIPLIDWGTAKGKHNLAKHNHQVVLAYANQSEIDFVQNVILTTEEFNRQKKYIEGAAIADSIANQAYTLTLQRFISGQVDLLRLQNSQQASIASKGAYINALRDYWHYYYILRKLTLFDFGNQKTLLDNFDSKFGF